MGRGYHHLSIHGRRHLVHRIRAVVGNPIVGKKKQPPPQYPFVGTGTLLRQRYVKSVFIIHVGGTRGVTSRTGNIMKIHARITLTVEFIRTCIFLFLFYVQIKDEYDQY